MGWGCGEESLGKTSRAGTPLWMGKLLCSLIWKKRGFSKVLLALQRPGATWSRVDFTPSLVDFIVAPTVFLAL